MFRKFKTIIVEIIDKLKTKIYRVFKSTVFKTIIVTVTATIIATLVIAFGNYLYDYYKNYQKEEIALNKVSLGFSRQYLDDMFGIPQISVLENEINHCFYFREYYVIRISYVEDRVVAYFFIITSIDKKIEIERGTDFRFILGEDTYTDFYNGSSMFEIDASYSTDPKNIYYSEWLGTGRWFSYNYIVCGTIYLYDGSISEKYDDEICKIAQHEYLNKNMEFGDTSKYTVDDNYIVENYDLRNKTLPNVIGIVDYNYADDMYLSSPKFEWTNIMDLIVEYKN